MEGKQDRKIWRGIALLSFSYGMLALLFGLLLVRYISRHPHATLETVLAEYRVFLPVFLLRVLELIGGLRLSTAASFAFLYTAARMIEAYGMWRMRPWGAWFCSLSILIYVPFELWGLIRRHDAADALSLTVNLAILVYLLRKTALRKKTPALPEISSN